MLQLLLAFLLVPQDHPPQKCTLSGTVVNSVTGEPLSKVGLTLFPVGGGIDAVTVSGEKGVFSLVDLPPGDYNLRGEHGGYLPTSYNARSASSKGAVISLAPGQERTGLTLKLLPAATISGTVRDSDGEPLEDAQLTLFRRMFVHGELRVQGYDSAETDERGQYRIRRISPGRYFVSARKPGAGWKQEDHSPKTPGTHYDSVLTFYPGALNLASAVPVEVTAGKEMSGVDIKLLTVPVFRISGRVAAKGATGTVTLMPSDTASDFDELQRHAIIDPHTGDFEFRQVPAGSYVAQANATFTGSAPVEVGSQDVENVRLVPAPPAQLKGLITIDDEGKLTPGSHVYISNDKNEGPFEEVSSDQTFSAPHIQPGKYRVDVESAQMSTVFYVRTIRGEVVDEATGRLTIPPGAAASIEIVLGKDGAEVTGTVNYKEDDPPSYGTVVLIPDGPMHEREDRYYVTEADQFGEFRIVNVAPGKYKAFAWDEIERGQWFDPDFLDKYWKSAGSWEVGPNGHFALNLSLLHTAAR